MPNTKSAQKRVRQSAKRNSLNLWRKRRIKDQTKAFLRAVQEQDVKTAETEYRKTVSLLDKVSSTSTMHKNTASRRKSRLNKRLKDLKLKSA
ncbi:MAG: 30S ribosomal protein S20 [Planctomycetota bacterium]